MKLIRWFYISNWGSLQRVGPGQDFETPEAFIKCMADGFSDGFRDKGVFEIISPCCDVTYRKADGSECKAPK